MKPSKPYIIGLTGGIASGKSTLAKALAQAGTPVIDADQISRELTAPGGLALPHLRQAFGEGVFENGHLNRQALGALVFSDEDARARLNGLLHPLIWQEMKERLAQLNQQPAVVLDVPLLFESGWDKHCHEVWSVWVPPFVQVIRMIRRDGLTWKQACQRLKSQMPGRERRRRSDHVIYTGGSKDKSARKALALWQDALRRAQHGH